jgi:hypothetical protein
MVAPQYGQISFVFECSRASTVTFQVKIAVYGELPLNVSTSFHICVDHDCRYGIRDNGTQVEETDSDAAGTRDWYTGNAENFSWSSGSPEQQVAPGVHTVILSGRERGVKIQSIKIVEGAGECFFSRHVRQASVCPPFTMCSITRSLARQRCQTTDWVVACGRNNEQQQIVNGVLGCKKSKFTNVAFNKTFIVSHSADGNTENFLILDLGKEFPAIEGMATTKIGNVN